MNRISIIGFRWLLTLTVFLAFSCLPAVAQSGQPNPPPPPLMPADQRNEPRTFATLEEEMRAKRAIQAADKAHKDNLNRARNLASLGASLCGAFKEKSHLDREDIKKLEKAEKLTKSIRDAFGGSTDEVSIEKPPANLADALTQFADLTESLRERVEKTPKRVVSATVIDEANVLLELIRIVRGMQPKA